MIMMCFRVKGCGFRAYNWYFRFVVPVKKLKDTKLVAEKFQELRIIVQGILDSRAKMVL